MSEREAEYEYQFWGFTARDISGGIGQVVFDQILASGESMAHALQTRCQKEEKLKTLAASCQLLLNELAENSKEHLKNLEEYLCDTFRIPPHILLQSDEIQRQQYTEQERKALEEEIQNLWKQVHRNHFLNAQLSEELEKHDKLKIIAEKLRQLESPPVASLPDPKLLHNHALATLGLEVEEAGCHLKKEDVDIEDEPDPRDTVLFI